MDTGNFAQTVTWVLQHGYPFVFLAMLIEGPIITSAAAFAASLGYLDITTVLILSFCGDTVADIVYYSLGYWGRQTIVERYGHRVGLSTERLAHMEEFVKRHTYKALIIIKLTPVIPGPGLMAAGASHIPWRKLLIVSAIMTIPKTLAFAALGYYFGQAYASSAGFVEYGQYVILLGILAVIAVYVLYKRITVGLAKRLEKL